MQALVANEGDAAAAGKGIVESKSAISLNPEVALTSINLVARKAQELHGGPVTKMLIDATEPARALSIFRRAEYAYDAFKEGKTIEDVVKYFDDERIKITEDKAGALFSMMTGEHVEIKVRKIGAGARRTSKLANKYWSFDADIDITVVFGDQTIDMDGFAHKIIPGIVKGECPEYAGVTPLAAAVMDELALNDCFILNVVIPAAVYAALGQDANEVAGAAEAAAYLTRAIPGCKMAAKNVGLLTKAIMDYQG